jgi:hypothetical protein
MTDCSLCINLETIEGLRSQRNCGDFIFFLLPLYFQAGCFVKQISVAVISFPFGLLSQRVNYANHNDADLLKGMFRFIVVLPFPSLLT